MLAFGAEHMGWRAWDAYERDAEAQRRALPWRGRYALGVIVFVLIVAAAGVYLAAKIALH